VRDQISHPYKSKITVILIFTFLERRKEEERF
jgi:hypothetical protein